MIKNYLIKFSKKITISKDALNNQMILSIVKVNTKLKNVILEIHLCAFHKRYNIMLVKGIIVLKNFVFLVLKYILKDSLSAED